MIMARQPPILAATIGNGNSASEDVGMTMRYWLVVGLVAGIGWSGVSRADAQDVKAGEVVFKSQCSICHSPQAGRNMVGPSLFGIVGRQAGTIPGFHYSP